MNREKFLNYNQERNEHVQERYELAIERIAQIAEDSILEEPYRTYFVQVSEVLLKLDRLWKCIHVLSLEEQKQWNEMLCSSDWAVKDFPAENPYKTVLSILCSEITSKLADVYRGRLDLLTIDAELFLEIYFIFQDEPNVKQVEQAIYWHNSDYADIFEEDLVERILGIAPSYEEELLWNQFENQAIEGFLYQYGYRVTERNWKIVQNYSKLSSNKIETLVDFVVKQYLSYQDGDNLKEKIVPLCFDIGLEPLVKGVIKRLQEKQVQVAVCTMEDLCSELLYDREYEKNKCSWMNRQYKERRVQVLRTQLERYKEKTKNCLSPLVLYSGEMDQNQQDYDDMQQDRQKKMWKEYFEQQENVLYSYIPYKTCIVL